MGPFIFTKEVLNFKVHIECYAKTQVSWSALSVFAIFLKAFHVPDFDIAPVVNVFLTLISMEL